MNSVNKIQRRVIAGMSVRWDDEAAKSAYERGLWVHETLADTLKHAASQTPERVLIVDDAVRLDAKTLYEKSKLLAEVMIQRLPAGSAVSFMLPNWHEAAVIYMAATLAGMIANPILPSLRDHDLRFMLSDVKCKMIFIPEQFRHYRYVDMLSRVTEQLDEPPEVVVLRGKDHPFTSYDSLFMHTSSHPLPHIDANAVRMIMYTSGTTGRPKGVMHSHNSIHALIWQIGKHWMVEQGDTFLVASPISHIGGSIYAFECPLLLGTTAVLMESWDADNAVKMMLSEHCTHFAGATPFLTQTLAAAQRAGTQLPNLKLFVCGGASVPPSLVREAAEYLERAIVTRVYGSTEVPVMTVGVTDDAEYAADTDGQPGLAHIKLCNVENSVADGGEVLAKGPQMLVGYLHPEDENNAFDDEGYFRTGDLGRWVAQKYLVIAGRAKDIIIRNGENIAPKELEDILINHPAIAEIAIVGIPDSKTGERACAVIVPNGSARPNVNDLAEFLMAKGVAKFKFPEQVVLWAALPKNEAGKVLKHMIRKDIIGTKP